MSDPHRGIFILAVDDVERVLSDARELGGDVIVIGRTEDGEPWVAASCPPGDVMRLIEAARDDLMRLGRG